MTAQGDASLTPGVVLEGRYEIVARLGEGGAGAVYEARQLGTRQRIALKILRAAGGEGGQAGAQDARAARLLREARLCAGLRHPHIVPLVDAGQAADGTLYLAFALVPGDTLAAVLAGEGALAPQEARHLMLQVLDALACAHAAGVVHRDLKPSNIMVAVAGARRDAAVLDFGIGAALGGDARAGDASGTPGYAAPEQWRGGEPSPRADLFSWGLVLLECLTGAPVYAGAPAERTYRLLGPDPVPIPPALARHPLGALIARVVEKDPAARDVTARELRGALAACELGELSREAMLGAGGDVRARRSAAAASAVAPGGPEAPLSGRDSELELLLAQWRRARGGAGQVSLVTGEPGIGKSRLVRELRARIAHEAHGWLEARCAPDTQHSALAPVIDLLERALGLDREATASGKVARLEAALAGLGLAPAEVMPLFLPLLSLPLEAPYGPLEVSAPRQRALTLRAIASLLFAIAGERPVLLIVEDLHWADATTLELLAQLVREAPGASMYVLMMARPEHAASFATAGVQALPLGRLPRPQIEAMLGALVGRKPLPPAVLEHVADRADGVPLFVEELLRMMIDAGHLVERDDRYELTGPLAGAAIPGTLRALLAARLERLARARETAQLAAALGREFSVAVLSAASPLGPAGVADDLERLMHTGLVQRKRRGRDVVGVFKHALIRDAAYESLPAGARHEVHARIAGTLEAQFPEVGNARPDLLAHHHAEAGQPRPAVGYAQRAAELALQRSAYAEATAHASHGVAWAAALPAAEAVEAELVANGALIQALMATRGWAHPEVRAAVDRSASLLEQLAPDSEHRVPTLWSLFTYHHVASNRRAARARAEALVAIAERSEDPGLHAVAATTLGLALLIDGELADARRAAARAIELYDPVRHRDQGPRYGLDSLVLAKTYMAQFHWYAGDDAAAFALVAGGVAWARELGHVPSIALGLLYGCTIHHFAGDRRTVAGMAREILALSEKYGLPAYEGYAATFHDWATGEVQRSQQIVEGLTYLGCKLGLSYYGSLVADSQAARGDLDAALACVDQCLARCRDHDEHFYEPELHRRRAMYEARRHPTAETVRSSLEEAARLARRYGMPRIELEATEELIRRFGGGTPHHARSTA